MSNDDNTITTDSDIKTVINVEVVDKVNDIKRYVKTYISDKDTAKDIMRLLCLTDHDRQHEFMDKPNLKKWFLGKLVGAAVMHYLRKNKLHSENTPDVYMHRDKLVMIYASMYNISVGDYREDASISFDIPYQLHRVFKTIKNEMGTVGRTADVVMRYGIDYAGDVIGDYKYVHTFQSIIDKVTSEYEINYPVKRGDSLTDSIYELCDRNVHSVCDVINANKTKKIKVGHADKKIVMKFNQMCDSSSINPKEMFNLCLMLFAAKSNKNWENIYTLAEIEFYDIKLQEMCKLYNNAADDIKNVLKINLSTYSTMDIEFTKTISLLNDLNEKDEYFSDLYDAVVIGNRITTGASHVVSDDIIELQNRLRDLHHKTIRYQKDITEYKDGNTKLREILNSMEDRHAQTVAEMKSTSDDMIVNTKIYQTESEIKIDKLIHVIKQHEVDTSLLKKQHDDNITLYNKQHEADIVLLKEHHEADIISHEQRHKADVSSHDQQCKADVSTLEYEIEQLKNNSIFKFMSKIKSILRLD